MIFYEKCLLIFLVRYLYFMSSQNCQFEMKTEFKLEWNIYYVYIITLRISSNPSRSGRYKRYAAEYFIGFLGSMTTNPTSLNDFSQQMLPNTTDWTIWHYILAYMYTDFTMEFQCLSFRHQTISFYTYENTLVDIWRRTIL